MTTARTFRGQRYPEGTAQRAARDATRARAEDIEIPSGAGLVRPTGDAGASTVELLVWFPGLLLIVVLVLQVFEYTWAKEAAQGAARYGAHHAALYGAGDADGIREANAYLAEVAGPLIEDPSVAVVRTQESVSVTITARPRQIPLPALTLKTFTVQAHGPIEQFAAGR
ncbi:TadE/TadG family type IV pilus assembly protein [Kineosporia babensis]|uniref:Pilus assembly protein n=1 Tax=Kineosporia babensis TaxID=499548 RepID=A0A9X1NKX7_9ACTN|nr:TadE/TadG family type IV pilus assembly protein [Kineosporia babensis]MCD5316847.1 pilus assembly protein [Kineosporia babensis]